MIPSGDYPLELKYTEKFGRIIRVKVSPPEKIGNKTYGRIRIDGIYCNKEIAVLIPSKVLKEVKKK